MSMTRPPNPRMERVFELKRPASVAVYETYADAQRAVDYLADNKFPVENLSIVGTDLKTVERVTGELNWGRVLMSGAGNGLSWGFMLAMFWYLLTQTTFLQALAIGLVIGVITGMLSSAVSYAATRGTKDFSSLSQVVATRYEILGEADVAPRARNLLSGGRSVPTRDLSAGTPDAAGAAGVGPAPEQGVGPEQWPAPTQGPAPSQGSAPSQGQQQWAAPAPSQGGASEHGWSAGPTSAPVYGSASEGAEGATASEQGWSAGPTSAPVYGSASEGAEAQTASEQGSSSAEGDQSEPDADVPAPGEEPEGRPDFRN